MRKIILTNEQMEQIKIWSKEDKTTVFIGKELGISRRTISKIMKYNNIPVNKKGARLDRNYFWKSGKTTNNGYVYILINKHPNCDNNGYFFEHRHIVEQKIERYLTKEEEVHHVNFIKNDNRIENLMLFPSGKAHINYHAWLDRQLPEFKDKLNNIHKLRNKGIFWKDIAKLYNLERSSINNFYNFNKQYLVSDPEPTNYIKFD